MPQTTKDTKAESAINDDAAFPLLEAESELDALQHFTYYTDPSRNRNSHEHDYTVEPFTRLLDTPSPILSAWLPTAPEDLNPDFLTPYHPSLHKNINNWSHILLDQVRQKGAVAVTDTNDPLTSVQTPAPDTEAQAALVSTVSATSTETAPLVFKGVSVVPLRRTEDGEGPVCINKHFLFQTHHRPQPPPTQQQGQGQQQMDTGQQTHRHRYRHSNEQQPQRQHQQLQRHQSQEGKEKKREEQRQQLHGRTVPSLLSATESPTSLSKTQQQEQQQHQKQPSVVDPSDPSLQYLSVSEDGDSEQSSPALAAQVQQQPNTMKIIDKIRDHLHQHYSPHQQQDEDASPSVRVLEAAPEAEKISSSAKAAAAATAVATALHKKLDRYRGPRMHPKLLELYDVTDRVLGVGTFATVKEIKLKSTGKSFALKITHKKTLQGKIGMLDTEIAVLSKVRHPNCVSLLEMFETEDAVYLVTDLAAGGELFSQLLKKGSYTEGDAARLVREILLGVEYLHGMGIVHRDLKPENLLFMDKSENARLMITDFGLSKVLTNGNDVLMTACGTPGYVAPEVLEQIGHGKPVDMWSVGIIAYTLLCGYTPFWGEDQPALFENIIAGEYEYEDEYWRDISPLAKSFIDSLLVRPAERRPTATQALSHPWFRAVLDQDMAAPASPSDSVNLLPGLSKNFNARGVFKKAVKAVGLLRKIQAAGHPQPVPVPATTTTTTDAAAVAAHAVADSIPTPEVSQQQRQEGRSGNLSDRDDTKDVFVVLSVPSTPPSSLSPLSSLSSSSYSSGGAKARPSHHTGLSFQDVVSAAVMSKQGANMDALLNEQTTTMPQKA
ncbi:hypothetical protein EDD11_008889 [Mortierella claussenii]|nr:hypothetical protein EDD11_008889 [Mortierella claussenii]